MCCYDALMTKGAKSRYCAENEMVVLASTTHPYVYNIHICTGTHTHTCCASDEKTFNTAVIQRENGITSARFFVRKTYSRDNLELGNALNVH